MLRRLRRYRDLLRLRLARRSGAGYDAFISYSQGSDAATAAALRSALHAFGRRWYRVRAIRVFQDVSSLAASSSLQRDLEQCLDRSRFLIVVASPGAARSAWVAQEIEYWLARRSSENVLLVRASGSLVWDASAGRFDPVASDALPPPLQTAFTAEPLHLRAVGAVPEETVARLSARIQGRDVDELRGEDVRQHRQARRLRRSAVALLAVLAVLASVAAVGAVRNATVAQRRAEEATSRQLAAQSEGLRTGNLDLALLLAAEAVRTAPTAEARSSLFGAVQQAGLGVHRFLYAPGGQAAPFSLETLAVSPDGHWAAGAHCPASGYLPGDAGSNDARIFVWRIDGGDGQPIVLPVTKGDHNVCELAFGPDGHVLLARDVSGRMRVWQPQTRAGRLIADPQDAGDSAVLGTLPDVFAIRDRPGEVRLVDARTGRDLAAVPGSSALAIPATRRILVVGAAGALRVWDDQQRRFGRPGPSLGASTETVLSSDGRRIALLTGGGVVVADTVSGALVARASMPGGGTPALLALSPDGTRLALATATGRVAALPAGGGPPLYSTQLPVPAGMTAAKLVFSPSGNLLSLKATADNATLGPVRFLAKAATGVLQAVQWADGANFSRDESALIGWDENRITTQRLIAAVPDTMVSAPVWNVRVSPDNQFVAAATGEGVYLWDLAAPREVPVRLPGTIGGPYTVAFDGSGRRLVAVGQGGTPTAWDLSAVRTPFRIGTVPIDPNGVKPALAPDGTTVAVLAAGGTVSVRDLRTGREKWRVAVPTGERLFGLGISSDGTRLTLSTSLTDPVENGLLPPSRLRIYRIGGSGRPESTVPDLAEASADGTRFVGVEAEPVAEAKHAAPVATIYRGNGSVLRKIPLNALPKPGQNNNYTATAALSTDGALLAVTDGNAEMAVYDTATGALRNRCGQFFGASQSGGQSLLFSPAGPLVAVHGTDGLLRLLDVGQAGQCLERASAQTEGNIVAFSHDGARLATSDIEIRETGSLHLLGTVPQLFPTVTFSPDDNYFFYYDDSGAVRRVPIGDRALARVACAVSGRSLTAAEWRRYAVLGDYRASCPGG